MTCTHSHTHTHSETLTLSSKWTLNGARKLPELTAAVKSKTRLAHQQPNMWDLTWKGFGFWHAGDVNQFMRILAQDSVSLPATWCYIADSSVSSSCFFLKRSWSIFSKITGNREKKSAKFWTLVRNCLQNSLELFLKKIAQFSWWNSDFIYTTTFLRKLLKFAVQWIFSD